MAVINLDAAQLKSLNTEIGSLDQSLLQNYLPQLEKELGQISSNVQNAELNSILNTISSQFESVKAALSTELPKLESFLEQQIQSYTTTEQEAADAVNAVVTRMQQLAGITMRDIVPNTPTFNSATGSGIAAGTGATAASIGSAIGTAARTGATMGTTTGSGVASGAIGATAGSMAGSGAAMGTTGTENGTQSNIYESSSETASKEGSGKSIFSNIAQSAASGAAVGGTIAGVGTGPQNIPLGAAIGGTIAATVPVVADLGGKALSGLGWLCEKGGSALEKWAGDW